MTGPEIISQILPREYYSHWKDNVKDQFPEGLSIDLYEADQWEGLFLEFFDPDITPEGGQFWDAVLDIVSLRGAEALPPLEEFLEQAKNNWRHTDD